MVKRLPKSKDPRILKDELIVFTTPQSKAAYPGQLRRVTALVELDGEDRVMVFLTNNLEWSPTSVAELYRCRWQIEVFFKQIKQTLQLADFLGNNANAVNWQLWRRCSFTCCCASRFGRVHGRTASLGCSPCYAPPRGKSAIWPPCSGAMGQHASPLPLQRPARSPKSCIRFSLLAVFPDA